MVGGIQYRTYYIGSNCPGISGTVPDFWKLSRVLKVPSIAVLPVPDLGQTLAHPQLIVGACTVVSARATSLVAMSNGSGFLMHCGTDL